MLLAATRQRDNATVNVSNERRHVRNTTHQSDPVFPRISVQVIYHISIRLQCANEERRIGETTGPEELENMWVVKTAPDLELTLEDLNIAAMSKLC